MDEFSQNDQAPLRIVEKHLEASDIHYNILRPNFFMENFSGGFAAGPIKETGSIFLPASDAKTSFISVKDIAATALKCFTDSSTNGKAYNLTGSEALDHNEVAAEISRVAGKEVTYTAISDEQMRESLTQMGVPAENIAYLSMLYEIGRAGYTAPILPDLESVINRRATTFKQFVEDNRPAWS